jgi:hypothetical protein
MPNCLVAGRNRSVTAHALERDGLPGVLIAGGFGVGWALWAASGFSGAAAAGVRIAGAIVGAGIVIVALVSYRRAAASAPTADRGSGSMFASRGYRVVVAAELVALVAGNALLGVNGQNGYVAAWTAFVVGAHFIGLGRLFTPMFYVLGAAFIAAATVGAAYGLTSGNVQSVRGWTGLIAAASLFLAGAWGLRVDR